MLGCLVAHELGHLLGLKPAPRGITKTTFRDKEMHLAGQSLLVFEEQEQGDFGR